jgi:hypothetical protein
LEQLWTLGCAIAQLRKASLGDLLSFGREIDPWVAVVARRAQDGVPLVAERREPRDVVGGRVDAGLAKVAKGRTG